MFVCPSCGLSAPGPSFCTEHGQPLVDARDDLLLGSMIGPYRLARALGRGGMGAVYLGVHPGIGSRVAVKVLLPLAAATPALVERFFAEARAVNVIRHESIVNVLDLDVLPDGRPYIVMEYLEGRPLSSLFAGWRPMPLDVLVRSMLEVLAALGGAHAAGITHRDLKPDNVFVTALGRIKVLDFGVAKLRPELGGMAEGTRTGALLGTPHYMSPEQAMGRAVDARSDLYSVGVMLFEGATGRVPFQGEALYELLHKHVSEPPPAPRALRPDMPPRMEAVILRALAKRTEDRFQSSAEMAEALAPLMRELPATSAIPEPLFATAQSLPTPAPPPTINATTATVSTPPLEPRRPTSVAGLVLGAGAVLVALLALVVASVGAYFAWAGSSGSASPDAGSVPVKSENAIDPIAHLPKVEQRARAQMADASLVMLSATSPHGDGTVDLNDVRSAISYTFRSPEASKGAGKRKCMVSVSVSRYGMYDTITESDQCNQELVSKPRCLVAQVVGRNKGGGEIASVSLMQIAGKATWSVVYANGSLSTFPDDCQ